MKTLNDETVLETDETVLETAPTPKLIPEAEQTESVEDVHKIKTVTIEKEDKIKNLIQTPKGVQKPKKTGKTVPRCFNCRIKVGVYGMSCKCGHVFCYAHRLPENHVCSYDFKTNHQELLEKQNPKVSPSKYTKI
eukprot:gene12444-6196_t